MISEKLVNLIENNADVLTRHWLEDVRENPSTPTYHTFSEEKLYKRAHLVYSQLSHWISRETSKDEIRNYYMKLGEERFSEGFALHEVISALVLLKRHLWLHILSDGQLSTAFELYQSLELNNRVVLFFDRAIYYTSIGFEEGVRKVLKSEKKLYKTIFGKYEETIEKEEKRIKKAEKEGKEEKA
jgi:hypothetical protein